MASFDAQRKDKNLNLPAIRLRSGKSKEELEAFRNNAKLVYNLNAEAKKAGRQDSESFSLRDNGAIWKFATNENGAWRRVTGWSPPSPTSTPAAPGSPNSPSASSGN